LVSGNKLLRLPDHGRLLVCADLRGNLRDFLQVVARFERLPEDRHVLFLGDLIHGPLDGEKGWPAGVGRPYRDRSPALLLKLLLLQERHPGRVHALLGNHEHAHIGGPRTSRFAEDEAGRLEARLGPEAADDLRRWLRRWPLLAAAPAGLLFGHRAPGGLWVEGGLGALDGADYGRYLLPGDPEAAAQGAEQDQGAWLLGQLLWAQPMSPAEARRVCAALHVSVLVYGHEVVRGSEEIGAEQLILSSSFLLPDEDKRVLEIDLAARYGGVADLRPGREILPLYD
jgi:hypothetical protein